MAVAYGNRSPRSSSLYDVLDLILDKGLVIDLYVRVSLVGIELLTVDARVVVASVDTYLRFAEAVNRLELGGGESSEGRGLPEVLGKFGKSGAEGKTEGALSGAGNEIRHALGRDDGEERRGGRASRRGGGFLESASRALTHDDQDDDRDDDQAQDSEEEQNDAGSQHEDEEDDEDRRPSDRSVGAGRRAPTGRTAGRR